MIDFNFSLLSFIGGIYCGDGGCVYLTENEWLQHKIVSIDKLHDYYKEAEIEILYKVLRT